METLDKENGLVVGTEEEALIDERIRQTKEIIRNSELNLKINKEVLAFLKKELKEVSK